MLPQGGHSTRKNGVAATSRTRSEASVANPLTDRLSSSRTSPKKPVDHVNELKTLVIDYAKQETVDPLKSLGTWLAYGIGGAISIGIGVCMLLLGLLRGLETIDALNDPAQPSGGNWSFAPYLITIVVGAIVIGVALKLAKGGTKPEVRS